MHINEWEFLIIVFVVFEFFWEVIPTLHNLRYVSLVKKILKNSKTRVIIFFKDTAKITGLWKGYRVLVIFSPDIKYPVRTSAYAIMRVYFSPGTNPPRFLMIMLYSSILFPFKILWKLEKEGGYTIIISKDKKNWAPEYEYTITLRSLEKEELENRISSIHNIDLQKVLSVNWNTIKWFMENNFSGIWAAQDKNGTFISTGIEDYYLKKKNIMDCSGLVEESLVHLKEIVKEYANKSDLKENF